MADAECEDEIGSNAPGILDVPLEFVGLEVAADGGAVSQGRAGGCAVELVVEDVGDLGNGSGEIGECDLIGVTECAADLWARTQAGVVEYAGIGGISVEPVRICGGAVE